MSNLPRYADMRDGALVSLRKPASEKLFHLTLGAGFFGLTVIFCLIVAAVAFYPPAISTQGLI